MEIIDDHLIIIYYKKQHYKKLPMYDGSDFQYLIDRIYNIRCCISGYDENYNHFENENDYLDYLRKWEKKCDKLCTTYFKDIKQIVTNSQYKLDDVNSIYW